MAETSRFIFQTVTDLTGLKRLKRGYSQAEAQSRAFAHNLSKDAKFIESNTTTSFSKTGKSFAKTTSIFEQNGQRVRVVTKRTGKDVQFVSQSIDQVNKRAKKSTPIMGDFTRALARVAIVVPVWFAFRTTISFVFRTLRDGIKDIVAFDKALQKAKRNLQGTTAEINANFKKLRQEVTKLSIQTGESVEDITNAFQKFATVGFDFETSLTGATSATKLAILLFGDATETANAFARSMRVMVDESEGAKTAGEQITDAMALTAKLWETNAFELGEFTESMEKFAGTARTMNFTTQETVALLATLSTGALRAGRGGRLLRTAVLRLTKNMDGLAKSLGVQVNPEMDRTFDVLVRVIDKVSELADKSPLALEANQALADAFGGIRSQDPARVLTALNKELKENLALTADVSEFEKDVEDVTDTLSRQAKIWRNLNREIGKAFVTGLTGAEDFKEGLKIINEFLRELVPGIREWGTSINTITETMFNFNQIVANLVPGMKEIFGLDARKNIDNIKDSFADLKKTVQEIRFAEIVAEVEANPKLIRQDEFNEKLKEAIGGKGDIVKLQNMNLHLEDMNPDLSQKEVEKLREALRAKLKNISLELDKAKVSLPEPEAVKIDDFERALERSLDVQLDILKDRGVQESVLTRIKGELKDQLGIEESIAEVLERELTLEKQINQERKIRKEVSSDDIKLFRIAQAEGSKLAKTLSEALRDEDLFARILRKGGKEAEILQRDFGGLVEAFQAKQFFKGDQVSGKPGLRGGFGIQIDQEGIRDATTTLGVKIKGLLKSTARQIDDIRDDLENRANRIVNLRDSSIDYSQPSARGALPELERLNRVQSNRAGLGTPGLSNQINIRVGESKFSINANLNSKQIAEQIKSLPEADKLSPQQIRLISGQVAELIRTPNTSVNAVIKELFERN